MKQEIREWLGYFDGYDLEGSLDDVVTMLQKYQTKYKDNFNKVTLDYRDSYEGDKTLNLFGYRLETDKEEKAREFKEQAQKEAQEKKKDRN